MTSSRRVFVSYRRDDCAAHAGWLASTLRTAGAGDVFIDVENIGLGENFVRRIQREIESCDVVLVVIGDEWLTLTGHDGKPRIEDELDWVHLEVRSALERDVPVVPVLVEGALMPRPQQLPEAVRDLAYRNGIRLTEASWASDVGRLVAMLPPGRSTAPSTGTPAAQAPAVIPRTPPSAGTARRTTADDVVVIPATGAYPEYLESSAYVCQDGRTFRPSVAFVSFYFGREIKREVAAVLHRRDHVLWSPEHAQQLRVRDEPYDGTIASLIELNDDRASAWFGRRRADDHYQVFVLSAPDDAETIRLERPVHHAGRGAWTQNQRYADSAVLRTSPATTDELS